MVGGAEVVELAELVLRWASELGAPSSPGFTETFAADWRGEPAQVAWLCRAGSEAVGFLSAVRMPVLPWPARLDRGSLQLSGLYVVPEHRRRGRGAALLRAAERWAREERLGIIRVTAADETRGLYASVGFRPQPRAMTLRLL